jgi:DNA-binding PucR family transcriptional regulator
VAHDAENGSDLLPTLAAYLDAFGNVNDAAASVQVHPNTFRYRLRRLSEIAGLDLADPGARLAVMLQLKLYGSMIEGDLSDRPGLSDWTTGDRDVVTFDDASAYRSQQM